jgi:hypothetical protein
MSGTPRRRDTQRRSLPCVAMLLACVLVASAVPATPTGAAFTDTTATGASTWQTSQWLEVSSVSPQAGATLSGVEILSAEVHGSPDTVTFMLDGTPICTGQHAGSGVWTCAWDSSIVDNGTYSLRATAVAGQVTADSAGHTITVSNTPPVPRVVVGHGYTQNAGNDAIATVTRPAGVVDGDLILLIVSNDATVAGGAAPVTPPGFTMIRSAYVMTAGYPGITAYWRIADAEPATYSVAVGEAPWHVVAGRLTGHDPSNPIGNHSGTAGEGGSLTLPGFATSGDDAMLIAAAVVGGHNATFTLPAGMTPAYSYSGAGNLKLSAAGAIQTVAEQGPTGDRVFTWTGGGGATQRAGVLFEIPPGRPPKPPATLSAAGGAESLGVSWDPAPRTSTSDVRHRVQGTAVWQGTTGIAGTTHTITGLAAGTTYEVAVRGRNSFGPGPWSVVLTPTTAP